MIDSKNNDKECASADIEPDFVELLTTRKKKQSDRRAPSDAIEKIDDKGVTLSE